MFNLKKWFKSCSICCYLYMLINIQGVLYITLHLLMTLFHNEETFLILAVFMEVCKYLNCSKYLHMRKISASREIWSLNIYGTTFYRNCKDLKKHLVIFTLCLLWSVKKLWRLIILCTCFFNELRIRISVRPAKNTHILKQLLLNKTID